MNVDVTSRPPQASSRKLYAPRWRWPPDCISPQAVVNSGPRGLTLDLLGIFDPPNTVFGLLGPPPEPLRSALENVTFAFGAAPFAVTFAVVAALDAALSVQAPGAPSTPPLTIAAFGPGAAAVRAAANAVFPGAEDYLLNVIAVPGRPDDAEADPLPLGVWPAMCPLHSQASPLSASGLPPGALPLFGAVGRTYLENLDLSELCERGALTDILGWALQSSALPDPVRMRASSLLGLFDRFARVFSVLGHASHQSVIPTGITMTGYASDEINQVAADAAYDLTLATFEHMQAFYARIRPAAICPSQRRAASLLRHRVSHAGRRRRLQSLASEERVLLCSAGWIEASEAGMRIRGRDRYSLTSGFLDVVHADIPARLPGKFAPIDVILRRSR